MKLIADSGSTKTDWRLMDGETTVEQIQSAGINPFYQAEKDIRATIEVFYDKLKNHPVQHIYFYGAGCSFEEKKQTLKNVLQYFFPMARAEVQSDMLGVARALLGKQAGIACILGTGSNSCFYDGQDIVQNVPSLGFTLGDEGSGATLGRLFVSDVLKNQLPADLTQRFFAETATTPEAIMENVYRKPFPNRYLASFTRFLAKNTEDESIHSLIHNCFVNFFERNIKQYDYRTREVHFAGSVAWYFQDILKEAARTAGVSIGKIAQNPMEGLVGFHQ
jgi:N-acetylglucosamine kinase-like BadF-type ATPase